MVDSARSQMKNFLFEQAAQTPDPLCVKFLMLDASASMRNEVVPDLGQTKTNLGRLLSCYSHFSLNGNDRNGSLALDFEIAQHSPSKRSLMCRQVSSVTAMPPGTALPAMRAAILTVSPQISNW